MPYLHFHKHCVKSVRIRSFSGTYFPAFKLKYLSVFSPYAGTKEPEKLQIWTLFMQLNGLIGKVDGIFLVKTIYFF